ncbi:sigma-70 family RNA polymerase sigma factor [Streptomyces sp. SYSU K217416]
MNTPFHEEPHAMPHTDPTPGVLPQPLLNNVGAARHAFLTALDPLRPELYRYCRRLTSNVWDAEDLIQETLTRAFTRAAQSHQAVQRPMAWLVRIATNAYLDSLRRPAPLPLDLPERATPADADPAEVRDALAEITTLLSPQERAALVLKDVFDLPLKEISAMLNTSEGAVKAALHRGRGRLNETDRDTARGRRHAPERPLLDALAAAFSAYDLDRLTQLFLTDAVSEVTGMVHEVGRDRIAAGSLHHTLYLETDVRWRAEVRELDDEPLVLLWATPTDAGAPEALEDVLRVQSADGGISHLRWYYFCPEILAEVGERLCVPYRTHGYRH